MTEERLSNIITESVDEILSDWGFECINEAQFYSKCYLNSFAKEFRLKLNTEYKGNELTSRIHKVLNRMGIVPDSRNQYSISVIKDLLANRYGKMDEFREIWKTMFERYVPSDNKTTPSPYVDYRRKGESDASIELLKNDN